MKYGDSSETVDGLIKEALSAVVGDSSKVELREEDGDEVNTEVPLTSLDD